MGLYPLLIFYPSIFIMKKKYFFSLALFCFLSAVFYNCAQKNTAQLFPNQGSELALLMRSMFDDFSVIQKAVSKNKIPKQDFREKFKALHSAKPTEEKMKNENYMAMSTVFLKLMDKLYEPGEQIEDYNILVSSCVTCHQNHCPGPIPKIKKLLITE